MAKYLFENLELISEFKNDKNTAIITDIDGTISEIVPTPGEAVVNADMKQAIVKLKEKFKLVGVISGRSVYKAQEMVGVDGILYVGNHGMEYIFDGEYFLVPEVKEYLSQIKQCGGQLNEELCHIPGILFEDKGICHSIHYRQCNNPEMVRSKIIKSIQNSPHSKNLQISEGRKLVELKPPSSYDKGTIINKIIEEYDLKKIIYLGDDITDVDAFKRLNELEKDQIIRSVSVLVISKEIPTHIKNSASFFLLNIKEVLRLFRWLLD